MADMKTKKTPVKAAPKTAPATTTTEQTAQRRRTMTGVVVSDKMMKTRVVRIERQVRDGMYGKYITKANKFKFHDEGNKSKTGDMVTVVESRPISRDKCWTLQKIVRSAKGEVLTKI
jgi:small subunit ribosomal protein S17